MKPITAIPFALMLMVVLISILLPNTAIAWMREHCTWFNQPMLMIERMHSAVNVVHAVLFLLTGIALRAAMPEWRLARVGAAFLAFGILTELVQFLIPGRHPRLSDVLVDFLGGVLGWVVMRILGRRV